MNSKLPILRVSLAVFDNWSAETEEVRVPVTAVSEAGVTILRKTAFRDTQRARFKF